jgi:hypothetical protein
MFNGTTPGQQLKFHRPEFDSKKVSRCRGGNKVI